MAIPKVFISSTCFDLSEIREQLSKFVSSFGFDPILSDHGDVFYHPELHTHEACVHEVSNCQLFILIIGGRYGGSYTVDKTKSITNAEYEAAINHGIPVFTYIKKDVLSDHHIYTTNSKSEIANQITYPSITKQTDSLSIFNFINQVRRQNKNNSYEGFDNFGKIESHLRKQWAGMFFDFLRTKEIKSQIDATNHLLTNLKSSNAKLEELVKSLYLSSSDNKDAISDSINSIEKKSLMGGFFEIIISILINNSQHIYKNINDNLNSNSYIQIAHISPREKTWYEYIEELNIFKLNFEFDSYPDEENPSRLNECIIVFLRDEGIGFSIPQKQENKLEFIFSQVIVNTTEEERLNFYNTLVPELIFMRL
ncbi:MAG: DUF4062 domain-containing protein [Oceanospirillaceae bacterium]|nr:DUF4062 domain-containing protein [Oceanospirillaceae bacterium]